MAIKPKPRYGWHGQPVSYCRFPIGSKVYITGGVNIKNAAIAEVIELGDPPKIIAGDKDLVYLRILEQNRSEYGVGYEDWWNEWQLEAVE